MRVAIVLFALATACASSPRDPPQDASRAPPSTASAPSAATSASAPAGLHPLRFQVRRASFAPGDDLRIEDVLSERDDFADGGAYVVRGRYTLASHSRASLTLFALGGAADVTPTHLALNAGSGAFEFRVVLQRAGYLRLSFRAMEGSEDFGSATFGRGAPVYRMHATPAAPSSSAQPHVPPTDERPVD